MPLLPGTRLGCYEITGPIGAGGMGEVYQARDTTLKRDVALKILSANFSGNPELMARFQREAEVLASLDHPNIGQIYGIVESEGRRALALALVDGPTLADRIAAGPLPMEEAHTVAQQIVAALEYAHERGVIHRDLKPANIKITPDGVVKVLDFGLAKVLEDDQPQASGANSPTLTLGHTRAGIILGTAAYMSPEQAVGKAADRRSDIFSFGSVLFEMLTALRPFRGETTGETLVAVAKDEPDWSKLPAQVTPAIQKLLHRCLIKDRKQRLQAIGEARIALSNPEAEASSLTQQTMQPTARLVWVWLAAAAVFAVGTLALGLVAYRHASETPPAVARFSYAAPEKGVFLGSVPPAVSPDGRHIVFGANVDGKDSLWIRDVDSLSVHQLTEIHGNRPHPFWSPNSHFLAYFDGAKLMKIDISGGPGMPLCDVKQGRGGSWSKNDVILFSNPNLFRVSADGGTPVPVTEIDHAAGETTHRYPWFLPDGHRFLYTISNSNQREKVGIYVADLESKGRRQVLGAASNALYVEAGFLLYMRERTLMSQPFDAAKARTTGDAFPVAEQVGYDGGNDVGLFSASTQNEQNGVLAYTSGGGSGNVQITWFDRSGKPVSTVGAPGLGQWVSLSPDGVTVAVSRRDGQTGNAEIWLRDLARARESLLTPSGSNRFPVWSPDSRRVAFVATRNGTISILARAANGTGQEQVLATDNRRPVDWSLDGRYLIAEETFNDKTANDIWVYPQFGDKRPFPYLHSEAVEAEAKLSPNGHWLAYRSNESKRNEIYVVSFPMPDEKWPISTNGGGIPVWSRDGRELYFISGDNKMMAAEIKTTRKFDASVPKPLFDVHMPTNNANFDVSKDGLFLVPTPTEASGTPMTVVLNWQVALKK